MLLNTVLCNLYSKYSLAFYYSQMLARSFILNHLPSALICWNSQEYHRMFLPAPHHLVRYLYKTIAQMPMYSKHFINLWNLPPSPAFFFVYISQWKDFKGVVNPAFHLKFSKSYTSPARETEAYTLLIKAHH